MQLVMIAATQWFLYFNVVDKFLVVACAACDQRLAFSENTTGTIWCAFQRELTNWRLTLPRRNCTQEILFEDTSFE